MMLEYMLRAQATICSFQTAVRMEKATLGGYTVLQRPYNWKVLILYCVRSSSQSSLQSIFRPRNQI